MPTGTPSAPAAPFAPQRTERCSTRRGVRTCRYYVSGELERVCITRRGVENCYVEDPSTRRKAAQSADKAKFPAKALLKGIKTKVDARTAVSILHGYTNPVLAPIGRFYRGADGWCSGTLIKRGVVLTAAHCLWDQSGGVIGVKNYFPGLTFYPGHRYDGGAFADYGGWPVVQSFVPQAYANGDNAADWGIAVLAPDGSGNYAGDYTGTYTAWGNVFISYGTPFYNLGYPASYGFTSLTYGGGNAQYFCYMTWDGDKPLDYQTNPLFSNGFWFYWPNACPMNGGSSGGPNIVTLATGEAAIVAVNNRGVNATDARGAPLRTGFGLGPLNIWLDQRFLDFAREALAIIRGSGF